MLLPLSLAKAKLLLQSFLLNFLLPQLLFRESILLLLLLLLGEDQSGPAPDKETLGLNAPATAAIKCRCKLLLPRRSTRLRLLLLEL